MIRVIGRRQRVFILASTLVLPCVFNCKSQPESKPPLPTQAEGSAAPSDQGGLNKNGTTRTALDSAPDPNAREALPKGSEANNGGLPQVKLVGVVESVAKEVEAAYQAASASPSDPAKVGELGIVYYSCVQEPMAASQCFARATRLDPKSASWPYFQGLAYKAIYEDKQAVSAFERTLAIDPNYAPAMVLLAGAVRKEDPTRAAALYRRSVELNPADARAYVGLGQCAVDAKKGAEAIQFFRQALEVAPDYGQAHAALAEILETSGNPLEAERHKKAAKTGGDAPLVGDPLLLRLLGRSRNSDYLVALAHRVALAYEYDDALRVLDRAIECTRDHRAAQQQIGAVLTMAGRQREAEQHFRSMLAADRSNTYAQTRLAGVLADQGKLDEAVKLYQDVLSFRPEEVDALEQLGRLLLVLGRPAEAQAVFEKLAVLEPNDASSQIYLVVTLVCVKDYGQAVSGYRFAQGLLPDAREAGPMFVLQLLTLIASQQGVSPQGDESVRLALSDLSPLAERFLTAKMEREAKALSDPSGTIVDAALEWARRGEFRRAMAALNSVMPLDQGGRFAGTRGSVLVMQRRYGEAEGWFRKALAADPTSTAIRSNLGGVLSHLGKHPEAETLLRDVVREKPEDASALQQLGILLNRQGKSAEALALWERAVVIRPGEPQIYIAIGGLLARQGKFTDAIEHFRKALAIDPTNAAVHYQLGVALAAAGDSSAALAEWQKASTLQPGHVEATSALAGAAMMKGDYAAAERLLREGLRLSPGSATFANGLAWILATCPEAGRRDGPAAVRWAQNACDLTRGGQHKFVDTLAAALAEAGQFDKAVEAAGKAIALAEKAGDPAAAKAYSGRRELFKNRQPYRDHKSGMGPAGGKS